jgi:uncharacterized protein (DUF885 family)
MTPSILSRRDFLRLSLLAGSSLALAPFLKACAPGATPTPPPVGDLLAPLDGLDIERFFEDSFTLLLLRDPEGLTELGLADIYGVGDADLTDVSDAFIRQTQALESGILARLRAYDRSLLSDSQALSADVYDWYLDDLVRLHDYMYDDYPLNPIITSLHLRLYFLFTEYQPLENAADARDYISRLSQVGAKVDQILEGLSLRRERGVILPAFIIRVILPDLQEVAGVEAARTWFHTALAEKLDLASLPAEERTDLLAQAQEHITSIVIPAYQRLVDFFEDLLLQASDEIGVWQFPDGDAFYACALRHHTTTGEDAAQIDRVGAQHLERIHADMRARFDALGYPQDASISSLYARLTTETGVYRGQESVLAYEEAIRQAELLLPEAFDLSPRAGVIVVGGDQGDFYMPPAYDGSRPGIFFARTGGATPRFGVKTLAYHETIPGHHLQIAIAQELPDQPAFRLGVSFTGYAEGWALYAERLMMELGAYQDDIPGDLGRLQAEAFRAARLVVDTGIHARRLSFDAAADFLAGATGFPLEYAQREITRYAVWAGQATAYYTGFLSILDMRQRAMDALGDGFDLKAFHRLVVGSGAVPLLLLESLVDAWIGATA